MQSPRRRLMFKLILLVGAVLFALVLVELGLRVAGLGTPIYTRADPILGASLAPDGRWRYTKEGNAEFHTNSEGLRDVEHAVDKPANTFRIAVLGDSYTEARQVDLEDAFPRVIERELNQRREVDDPEFEVFNFGLNGSGTDRQLLMLRHRVWKYDPDLILLAFLTGNDIRDNSIALSARGSQRGRYPFFRLVDGELVLDESFKQNSAWKQQLRRDRTGITRLINSSSMLQVAVRSVISWRSRERPAKSSASGSAAQEVSAARAQADTGGPQLIGERGLDPEIYAPPTTPQWEEAWAITEKLLLLMRDETLARGARFLVVTLSNGHQVHPDLSQRQGFMERLGVTSLLYADDRIAAFCAEHGIPVLGLVRPLQQAAARDGVFFHGFDNTELGRGHWNEAGHQFGGRMMAEEIRRMLAGDRESPNATFAGLVSQRPGA